MRRHTSLRLLISATLAGSAVLAATALPGAVAAATPKTVSCNLSGNASSQALSGCTGTGVGTGEATATGTFHSSGLVNWTNGKKTQLTLHHATGNKSLCAAVSGYTVDLLEIGTGTVAATGTTTPALVGGTVSGDICVYKKGTTILVKSHGKFSF